MSWSSPVTWLPEQLVVASDMNVQIRDNLNALRDYLLGVQDLGAGWQISAGRTLSLQDSDVAHGMTGLGVATDVYGVLGAWSGTAGGTFLQGLSDTATDPGLVLYGIVGNASPSTGVPIVHYARKKNGTSAQALADGEIMVDFQNSGTSKASVYGSGKITVADSTFALDPNSGNPQITFDSNDVFRYTRGSNLWEFIIGGNAEMSVNASGLAVTNGLVVGFSGTPGDDEIQLGDASFKLDYVSSTDVRLQYDTNDYIQFDRSSNLFRVSIGSAVLDIDTDKASFAGSLHLAERSDPSAPDSNQVYIYAKDNGAGKTQLVARFPTGAVQPIATEP